MGVVAAAMIVALAIWALARLLDVELTVGNGHVSAADVVVTALLEGLAALGVRAQLPSAGPIDPGHLSAAALAISIIGPTWLADGLARVVLIGMHVAVGLVLIVGFTRLSPRPAHQHPTFGSESHQRRWPIVRLQDSPPAVPPGGLAGAGHEL